MREYSKRTKELIVRAYGHLTNQPDAEYLFERRLAAFGVRYRAQWLMEPWIVDFYLPDYGLIIEIDGATHDGQDLADARRTAGLRRRRDVSGLARVRNQDVETVVIADVMAGKYDHYVGDVLYKAKNSTKSPPIAVQPAVLVRRGGRTQP